MSRKILVAYDGSSFSKRAIDEAKSQLALVPDTKLHVIAVAERTGPMTNKVLADAFTDDQVEYARKLIAEVEEHFAKEDIPVVTKVVRNTQRENPGKSVCRYAHDEDMDMIIAGSRGLGNVRGIVLGSVSYKIVQDAECPVLIVK